MAGDPGTLRQAGSSRAPGGQAQRGGRTSRVSRASLVEGQSRRESDPTIPAATLHRLGSYGPHPASQEQGPGLSLTLHCRRAEVGYRRATFVACAPRLAQGGVYVSTLPGPSNTALRAARTAAKHVLPGSLSSRAARRRCCPSLVSAKDSAAIIGKQGRQVDWPRLDARQTNAGEGLVAGHRGSRGGRYTGQEGSRGASTARHVPPRDQGVTATRGPERDLHQNQTPAPWPILRRNRCTEHH